MSRRYLCKADANQPEIVKAIRAMGGTVLHMHTLGKGAPDIAVGYGGITMFAEIKDGDKKLTPDKQEFHNTWTGGVYLIRNTHDAERMVHTLMAWSIALRTHGAGA